MKKKVYISGMMSNLPRSEYMLRFHKAEMLIQKEGYEAVNPTRFPPCRWPWLYKRMGYTLTLLYDLWCLSHCDLIYKMQGWQESRGANIESCWAYHFKIWQLPNKVRERIDKRMARFIDKREQELSKDDNNADLLQPVQ